MTPIVLPRPPRSKPVRSTPGLLTAYIAAVGGIDDISLSDPKLLAGFLVGAYEFTEEHAPAAGAVWGTRSPHERAFAIRYQIPWEEKEAGEGEN